MMIRLKDTPTSGFYLFEVNSLIKKSLLLQLVFSRPFLPMKILIQASTLIVKNLAEANTFLEKIMVKNCVTFFFCHFFNFLEK